MRTLPLHIVAAALLGLADARVVQTVGRSDVEPQRIVPMLLPLLSPPADGFQVAGAPSGPRAQLRTPLRPAARLVPPVAQARSSAAAAAAPTSDGKPRTEAKAPMDLNPPRGTRDFYPEDMALRTWLFTKMRDAAALYGFEEYDAPVLETEELYIRKAGEDVSSQLYSLEDQSGRQLCLRPEMTPSLARMVLSRRNALPLPLKWFSIPQCWRYERMTRGRRREHYQWNMDVWGVPSLNAEVELLAAAVSFVKSLGLGAADVGVKVSTRRVLQELLEQAGVPPEDFASTCVLVDKLDKLPPEEVLKSLIDAGLESSAAEKLLATLAMRDLAGLEEALGPDSPAVRELKEVFALAEAYGLTDWLVLDLSVVRGLAYYTGVVFEGFDRAGELRAIFGGGRYDKLLSTFGGEDLPAAGFGFGDAVIVELLKAKDLLPSLSPARTVLVACLEESLRPVAMAAAAQLREAGLSVDVVLEAKKPKWVFKHADRTSTKFVAIFGPQEAEQGLVRVKALADGAQTDVPIPDLAAWITDAAGSP